MKNLLSVRHLSFCGNGGNLLKSNCNLFPYRQIIIYCVTGLYLVQLNTSDLSLFQMMIHKNKKMSLFLRIIIWNKLGLSYKDWLGSELVYSIRLFTDIHLFIDIALNYVQYLLCEILNDYKAFHQKLPYCMFIFITLWCTFNFIFTSSWSHAILQWHTLNGSLELVHWLLLKSHLELVNRLVLD